MDAAELIKEQLPVGHQAVITWWYNGLPWADVMRRKTEDRFVTYQSDRGIWKEIDFIFEISGNTGTDFKVTNVTKIPK